MNETAPRGNRAIEEKTTRRRQRGSTVLPGLKLGVREDQLDRANYQYRYINDIGGRIQSLTEGDDYDLVRDPSKAVKGDSTNEGALVSVVVGTGENNQPIKAYLARKPKPYYDADQKEKRAALDEQMKDIKRGQPQSADAAQISGATGYVPSGGISIDEGRRG